MNQVLLTEAELLFLAILYDLYNVLPNTLLKSDEFLSIIQIKVFVTFDFQKYNLLEILKRNEHQSTKKGVQSMKKALGFLSLLAVLLVLTATALAEDIPIDAAHFPDANFLAYVTENADRDGNGVLSEDERKAVVYVNVSQMNIASLQGIEYFRALQTLYCASNQLTSLDVSANRALQTLYCSANQLTSLNVSGCSALRMLDCSSNQLTSLDVSVKPALQTLWCGGNQLTSLDVSGCSALQKLYCPSNELSSLDVSGCSALQTLHCYSNQLNSLDVSGCSALQKLNCHTNQLTSLDVSANPDLQELTCCSNQLTLLDVSANSALKKLWCYANELTVLDVSANPALEDLSCYANQLTLLNVSANPDLQEIWCYANQLTSLDVSSCTALQALYCSSNQLPVSLENGSFDLSALEGFDAAKASNWKGGTVSGTALTVPASGIVTYTYDCGGGYSETFTLNVTVPGEPAPEDTVPVTSIKLNKSKATLNVGKKITLKATVSPEDATDQSVKWKSSNKSVATVSSSGKVTAVGAGTAKITATAKDGSGVKATCTITVINPVTAIVLDQTTVSLNAGETVTLAATVSPDDAGKALNWESSNTAVATVDSEGKVTAVDAGNAEITATAADGSGVKAMCHIAVISEAVHVTSVKLNQTEASLLIGGKITLKATVSPKGATNKAVKWKSSDKSVATVSSSGKVTAVGVGTAKITATAKDGSGKKATCKITVTNPVTSIVLNQSEAALNIGETVTLKATVSPDDATDQTVIWMCSDRSVAMLSPSGKVTAVGAGTATITVSAQDGSGVKATCTITVKEAE